MECSRVIKVGLEGGLHARPAADVVKQAKQFTSNIEIENGEKIASARSSLKLMTLGVGEGDTITVKAKGEDADQAVFALSQLLENTTLPSDESFDLTNSVDRVASGEALKGSPGGGGKSLGTVFRFEQPQIHGFTSPEGTLGEELTLAKATLKKVSERLDAEAEKAPNDAATAILRAISDMARDEDWIGEINEAIQLGASAAKAVFETSSKLSEEIAAVDDAYVQARAEDIQSLARLVVFELQGTKPARLEDAPEGAIVIASDLGAAEAGATDLKRLGGLITMFGSPTSHTAILARGAGLSAIFGVGDLRNQLDQAETIAMDGDMGEFHLNPSRGIQSEFRNAIKSATERAESLKAYIPVRPRTKSGDSIVVAANLGNTGEIADALAAGAMGIGLFRTEFLFMGRASLPTEEYQYQQYKLLAESFADPVVIRTLDIGADKPARCLPVASEENPALGLRGVRLCLARPDVFKTQLRAILRAAAHGPVHLMIPMITDISEIEASKALLSICELELKAEGKSYALPPLGIMIETPAAVFTAQTLSSEVDFFSIGTNDLTQYVMAADRLNGAVTAIGRSDHPAVLKAIGQVCEAARAAGIWVGVCGEAAGAPELIEKLLSLGVRELSMAPSRILEAKSTVESVDLSTG